MRSHVFTDRGLAKHAGRFVWLSIDTEKEQNAGFLEKHPVGVWPTVFFIDPEHEGVALKWLGSMNVAQLERLLEDGERAVRGGGAGPEALLARADRLQGAGKPAEAAEAYRQALDGAPADWLRRPRATESLTLTLATSGQAEACARTAAALAPSLPRGPSYANVVATGLGCALELPVSVPDRGTLRETLEVHCAEALRLEGLLGDDRSGLYAARVAALDERGEKAEGRALAMQWLDFLEAEAKKASTAEARAAFDSHRVSAAIRTGDPARALPALEASERDLPHDYNPPARIALVQKELGRLDEALVAIERALQKTYGPRKLRVLETKAGLLVQKNDPAGARAVLQEALREFDALPAPQRHPRTRQRLQSALEKLGPRP